jgi:hypothetical protein
MSYADRARSHRASRGTPATPEREISEESEISPQAAKRPETAPIRASRADHARDPAEEAWMRGMQEAMAPVIYDPPQGCYGPFACSRLGPCGWVLERGDCPGIQVRREAPSPPRGLDGVIAADMASKFTRTEIAARVERLAARVAQPDATPFDQTMLDDWLRILDVKETHS